MQRAGGILASVAGALMRFPRSVALRLVLATALLAAFAAFLVARPQLETIRQEGIESAGKRADIIREDHLKGLIRSMEKFNRENLRFQLNAILQYPEIVHVEIRREKECLMAVGFITTENSTQHSFPLKTYRKGRVHLLGDLNVTVSFGGVDQAARKMEALLTKIFAGTLLATALLFFPLFHLMVARPLRLLRGKISTAAPGPPPSPETGDEVRQTALAVSGLIRELDETKKKLSESRSLHEDLYDTAFMALIRIRLEDGEILAANAGTFALTGYNCLSEMNADGFSLDDHHLFPEKRKEMQRLLAQKEQVVAFEARFRFKGGKEKELSVSLRKHLPAGYMEGSLVDITELRGRDAQFAAMEKALQRRATVRSDELTTAFADLSETGDAFLEGRKLQSLGDTIAALGHELRLPIKRAMNESAIVRSLARKERQDFDPRRAPLTDFLPFFNRMAEQGDIIFNLLRRTNRLVTGFRQLAEDQADETFREFNLSDYIRDAITCVRHNFDPARHTITVNCPADLHIVSYPAVFHRMVTGFLSNALHHAFPGEAEGRIRITASATDSALSISCTDDGAGMSDETKRWAFTMFYTTGHHKGMKGTGLSLIQSEVEKKLNGRIRCESLPGEGTAFHVALPLIGGPRFRKGGLPALDKASEPHTSTGQ